MTNGNEQTIVLVHGAWHGGWCYRRVADLLRGGGHRVYTPTLTGLGERSHLLTRSIDLSTHIADIVNLIRWEDLQRIILVGHSYGGMVMTDAATGNPNVKALVYVAAFAPDAGDSIATLEAKNPGSQVGLSALTLRPYPGGVDAYITPSVFHSVFCADVPAGTAAVMAATQRPIDAAVEAEPSGPPAWRTIPSWYLVASEDHAIPPATERFMARRAGATTVEISASHVAMVSHPEAVTDLILDAARASSK